MEMLGGSQIDAFLSATSLVWSSTIILIIIGLSYYFKYKDRNKSVNNFQFLTLYFLTFLLNILEYIINYVMQNSFEYEIYLYKFYIFVGLLWNVVLIFYIINFLNSNYKSRLLNIFGAVLVVISICFCIFLDIDSTLENSGRFYVLTGTLFSVYNLCAFVSNIILIILIFWYRDKTSKSFFTSCMLIFVIYILILLFEILSGYTIQETILLYSLLLFNTTSNQDKEIVDKLNEKKSSLIYINDKRTNLLDKVSFEIKQSLNNLVLYNDDLYLTKNYSKENIIKESKEIENTMDDLINYTNGIKDIFMLELNNNLLINCPYKLDSILNNVNSSIMPLAMSKNINYSFSVDDNTFINYVGDKNKIEKILINILQSIISKNKEGMYVNLNVRSKHLGAKNTELYFTIKNNDKTFNSNFKNLNIDNFINNKNVYDKTDLKFLISNMLLELFNTKINIGTDENNTIYSFKVVQGFKDNELFKK